MTTDFFYLVLSNGLRVIGVPGNQSVVVKLQGRIGKRAEDPDVAGSAHSFEHLFFTGTTKRPSPLALSKFIHFYGCSYNGSTGAESVNYWVKSLPEYANLAFEFLGDIFLNSLLRQEDVDIQLKIIDEEAKKRNDNPDFLIANNRLSTLYPKQKLGQTFAAEQANLNNITRESLLAYAKLNYIIENFVLVVSGNITENDVRRLAEANFAGWSAHGTRTEFEKAMINRDKTVNIENKDLAHSLLDISFGGFGSNDDLATHAVLLSNFFGGCTSARLFDRLRNELHLVYGAYSFHGEFSDTGFFSLSAGCDEANIQRVSDVLFEEIQKLLRFGMKSDELEFAQNRYLAATAMNFENPATYANYLASQLLFHDQLILPTALTNRVKQATQEDLMDVARKVFSDPPKITLLTKSLTELQTPDSIG